MSWRVGVIGAGTIAAAYLKATREFAALDPVAIADLDPARARARAEAFGVRAVLSPDALLADPDVDVVLNLTVPAAHAGVSHAALAAGKHVYSEKPLAVRREDGLALVREAEQRDLRIGCAPDTVLGPGIRTARAALDDGAIGRPLAATAVMASRGPDAWHPDPSFFYEPGAGPLFDFGPYYLSALVHLLGPVTSVAADAGIGLPERIVGSGPRAGTVLTPRTPTHVSALLRFAAGARATLTTSFDVVATEQPRLEVFGSEGTLAVPDPNTFGGPVRIRTQDAADWREVPLLRGPVDDARGIGLADMAEAHAAGRPHRASGELALHVLDVMETILDAAEARRWLPVETSTERPAALADDQLPARHTGRTA